MKIDYLVIEELLNKNPVAEFKAQIQVEEIERDKNYLVSDNFLKQEELLRGVFTTDIKQPASEINEEKRTNDNFASYGSDLIIIKGWKNVENISARLIGHYESTIVLECLIDKELGLYEEREFRTSLFADYEIQIGNLFLLRIFERQNEIRMEIHNDPDLTLKDDFPKLSFVEKFKDSKLFKKK